MKKFKLSSTEKNIEINKNDRFILSRSKIVYAITIVDKLKNDIIFSISPEIQLSEAICEKLENGNYKTLLNIMDATLASYNAIKV